ncbi:conserved hypothetical protein [Ricinus communis]|uniref:Uncharacterized protein n=1 Tax=Ricinus communis TaxID=3988 RepID=B9TEU2_RICCO|nr:conserved hypothetical protein [Ricinus communis]
MSTAAKDARERLVEALVQDQVNSYSGASDGWSQLESVFRTGFTGFENLSDSELVQAAKDSGVARELEAEIATLEGSR